MLSINCFSSPSKAFRSFTRRFTNRRRPGATPICLVSILFLFIIAFPGAALGQEQSDACKALPAFNEDFVLIDQEKSRIQKEVGELESRIKDYKETKIPQTEKNERELENIKNEIEKLSEAGKTTEAQDRQLVSLANDKKTIEGFLAGRTSQSFKDELKQFEDDYSWKVEQLRCINSTLSQMYSPLQNFKFWMSAFFAALIMFVIIGFFVIAYRDEKVRRAIFGGQTGLQFLTLFSIVIAIILFGVTNVLEGRELAALLGGLSGYILGKYNAPGGNENRPNGQSTSSGVTIAHLIVIPATITLSPTTLTQTLRLMAVDSSDSPVSISDRSIQWASDDPAVATVDQAGVVTYVGLGNCGITATINSVVSNKCSVSCI